jgi:hypothetical protein
MAVYMGGILVLDTELVSGQYPRSSHSYSLRLCKRPVGQAAKCPRKVEGPNRFRSTVISPGAISPRELQMDGETTVPMVLARRSSRHAQC